MKTRRLKWGFFEDIFYQTSWEPTFQTIELPFANFREANPNLDLRRLRTLRLRFDRTERGVIILDQIVLANGP